LWSGNYGQAVVAEVEVDMALDGQFGRIRHRGRPVSISFDLDPADVTTGRAEARRDHADGAGPLAEAGHR
jgi:hypothetical protein